jgi:hypothetical protein
LKFEDKVYWKNGEFEFPNLKRMAFTLPSDSTFREDVNWFKKKDENMAQKYKVKLEELQRNDRKLREKFSKLEKEKDKKKK